MSPAADFFRALPVGGKGFALVGSFSMHAAVALAVMRGAPHAVLNATPPSDAIVEIPLELLPAEADEQPVAVPLSPSAVASSAARHHHDYPVPATHDAAAHDPSLNHLLPLPGALNSPASPAPIVTASPAPLARFAMTVGPSAHAPTGTGTERGPAHASGESSAPEPVPEAAVDRPAKLIAGGAPSYTREAEAAGIEADVPLEIVIDSAGSVLSARALAHVGYGLDEAALRSVRGYRFSPAQRAGKALAVRMRWLMRFQLR